MTGKPLSINARVTSVHVTTWNHDEWTQGPYSTLGVGGRPHHRGDLAEPIEGRLVFAGEHTSIDFPGTMHGAYNSGVLAASRLKEARRAGTATVIGAGIAGLAAARQLTLAGWSVRIVEATDRIGGRARTDQLNSGILIHPGAAWIHGPDGNPIARIADAVGIRGIGEWPQRTAAAQTGWSPGEHTGPLAPAEAVARWLTAEESAEIQTEAEGVLQRLHERAAAARASGDDDDVTMLGPLNEELAAIADPGMRSAVKVIVDLHFESLMAADLDNLSLQHGDEPFAYPGGDRYLATPLQPLIDFLSSGLDITVRCPVDHITMRTNDQGLATGVRVALRSGEKIHSDVCVITVPLGALQAGSVAFEPPLPPDHLHALSRMRMGHKCKVFVAFETKWWGDTQCFEVYPAPNPTPTAHSAPTEWGYWVDTSDPCGQPVLCGFVGGAAAIRVQAQFLADGGPEALQHELTSLFSALTRGEAQ